MDTLDVAGGWLASSAVGGLVVLTAGSIAAQFCRQPVRRARIVMVTLLAALIVPGIGAFPIAPKWFIGLFPLAAAKSAPLESAELQTPAAQTVSERVQTGSVAIESRRIALSPSANAYDLEFADVHGPVGWTSMRLAMPMPSVRALAIGLCLAASCGLAAWWLIGQALIWRICRAARPVPARVRALFRKITGPAGRRTVLLESDLVQLPFTYTWARPVIVLPQALCDAGNSQELRFCLAHEWSHIEGRDALAWNIASLSGLVLCYQPLFWWLRRQLRLCQDYLADDRAASMASAEDYAMYLVRVALARRRLLRIPALGVSDRRSNLFRRVAMLVENRGPLARRCGMIWSVSVAIAAAALLVVAAGLRLEAAAPPDHSDKPSAQQSKPDAAPPQMAAGRTWQGRITEKGTGKPIAGADVVVEVSVSRDPKTNEPKTLREVHHTTGPDGAYEFAISPSEAAERLLYITLHVKERDHVPYFGGYSYGMILKNEKLGERPFYENLELWPGKSIEGVVQTPDGQSAAGVMIKAFTSPHSQQAFPDGGWAETKTDPQGHFRLVLHEKGQAVFWILPQDYAPETHGLKNDRRGDLGRFVLSPGIRFNGRVLDVEGKPVGGIYVEADVKTPQQNDDDGVPPGIADYKHRSIVTATDGTFTFRPLPAGKCRVVPSEHGWDPSTREGAHDPPLRLLPGVFTPHTVELKAGQAIEPLEIRAVPHVVVGAQIYNSKGQKRSGHEIDLIGDIDGDFWSARCQPTADGTYRFLAPHGLENAQMMLVTNEHSALQFRSSKGAPLLHSRNIQLGTLDHDVKGIEIIRYEAPIILVGAKTKDGKPLKDLKASVNYTESNSPRDGKYILKSGMRSDVSLEDQGDGRYRTSQLVPDREVEVTVSVDGFAPASRKVKLPEGKNEEVTLVLEPK
jgi:beta-lactamase regulating signal transducer with metallopeptidase domain